MEQLRRGWVFVLLGMIACGGTVTRQHSDDEGSSGSGAALSGGGAAGGTISIHRGGGSTTGGKADPGPGGVSAGGTGGTVIGGMSTGGTSIGIGGSGGGSGAPSCECIGKDCAPATLWTEPECGDLALQVGGRWLYALSPKLGTLTRMPLPPSPSVPEPLAKGMSNGHAFALDDKYAYVASNYDLYRVELESGAVVTLLSEPMTIRDVAVSAGRVFYTFGQTVKQAATEPPTSGVVVATGTNLGMPEAVAVIGDTLALATTNSSVELKALPGGDELVAAPSQGGLRFGHRALQIDPTQLYWMSFNVVGIPIGLVGVDTPRLMSVARGGSAVEAFAVDTSGHKTYFATEDGQIQRSTWEDARNGVEATSMAQGLERMTSMVVDGKHVYAASGCSVVCMRM